MKIELQNKVSVWNSLDEVQQDKRNHTTKLVIIQGQIIDQLNEGSDINSEKMKDLSQVAQNTKDLLSVSAGKASKLITELNKS